MVDRNPYAPSSASLEADRIVPQGDEGAIWRDGKVVVLVPDTQMPPRCVKCNAAASAPTKERRVYWHHWAYYLLFFINILIYVVVALIVRRKAIVTPGLCKKHRNRRNVGLAIGWTGVIGGLLAIVAGITVDPVIAALGVPVLLIAGLVTISFNRIVYAKRIDESYVRLKGVGRPFLDSLEQFPG